MEEKKDDRDQVWPGMSTWHITEEYQGAGLQVQDRRCYGKMERPSSYLDETNIGAGTDNQGHDFVVVNYEGEGRGRVEQGHDIIVAIVKLRGRGRGAFCTSP